MHGGFHKRLITSQHDNPIISIDKIQPASKRTSNSSPPIFVRQNHEAKAVQGRGNFFIIVTGDHDHEVTNRNRRARHPSHEGFAIKDEQRFRLPEAGRSTCRQ